MLLVPAAHFQGSPVRTPVTSLNVTETWVLVNCEVVKNLKGYTPCASVNRYQCFEGIRCLSLQGPSKKTECIAMPCISSGSVVTLSWKFTLLDCHWFIILLQNIDTWVEASWNVMAHAQETRFRLSAKRTSPFKSAGASVQSTTGSRGVRISGSNAGYIMFRGSVKCTGYPLHSTSFPFTSPPVRHRVPSHSNWTLPTHHTKRVKSSKLAVLG